MLALHYISLKDTVTRLTSTLIRSVECHKNDYHEKDTCINISTIITCTKVYNERHYFHQCMLTDTTFIKSTCITIIVSALYRHVYNI